MCQVPLASSACLIAPPHHVPPCLCWPALGPSGHFIDWVPALAEDPSLPQCLSALHTPSQVAGRGKATRYRGSTGLPGLAILHLQRLDHSVMQSHSPLQMSPRLPVPCSLLPGTAIRCTPTVCQLTEEVFMLTASHSPHHSSVWFTPFYR